MQKIIGLTDQSFQEQEVLRRFDRLLARMAEKNARFSDEEVAREVEAARDELGP